ncbi:MAG TPA: OmpA family protein [Polyangiaceae bacterium]|nr:OmpA family protein [Polyangiaceae bacterium]
MTKKRLLGWSAGLFATAIAAAAFGQNQAGASGSLSLSSSQGASASGDASASGAADDSKKYEPEDMMFEAGVFLGMMFPSSEHNLREDLPQQSNVLVPHEEFASVAPEFGARLAFYPLKYVGGEVEGGWLPTSTDTDSTASIYAARLHVIGQFPIGRITPFVLFGGGALGAGSKPMGNDTDPALHFGLGAKYGITPGIAIRADLRDTMAQKFGADDGDLTHFPEILVGAAFQLKLRGEKQTERVLAVPQDSDVDGITDDRDQCPKDAGIAPTGCPDKDSDGDGVLDQKDVCPAEAGKTQCGCPVKDTDGDGLPDELDKCPTEAGPINGCPDLDADKDGINTPDDKCPDQAEVKNGFDDTDGCPDEIPEKVRKFSGVIAGITFDTGKDTIKPTSEPVLTNALAILQEYPQLKIEISGHTDNVGTEEANVELSQKRADAVKAWFVAKGIDAARLTTRGAGPKEPIGDNKTMEGKQKNRRIEFKLQ